MAVPDYPIPTFLGGPGGPMWTRRYPVSPIYPVTIQQFQDLGIDSNQDAPTKLFGWTLEYTMLLLSEFAQLVAHQDAAFGFLSPFNFHDSRAAGGAGFTYSNCHYSDISPQSHDHAWAQNINVTILVYP